MEKNLVAEQHIVVNASPAKVWEALTNPELIKQYLFGTNAVSDWKEGSTVVYTGSWEGKAYEDKGVITKAVPEKVLQSTYWSNMSGTEDKPENYVLVTYTLEEENGKTKLTVTQDGCKTEESKATSENNWKMVLEGLEKVVEEQS